MSRFDKYNPVSGGFRAPLNAAVLAAAVGDIIPVSINSSGRVVVGDGGGGAVKIKGVICPVKLMSAGDIIDVMTDGEIVDATANDGTTALTAGTDYYATPAGDFNTTLTSQQYIGHTVETTRLVVRVGR